MAATTPGDRDRGRELAEIADNVATVLSHLREERWDSEADMFGLDDAVDRLRALAAPAETEAGDLPALYWSPTAGLITGAIHDQWSSIDGDDPDALPADARRLTFAASPPAQGPAETEPVVRAARALIALHDDPMLCNTGGPRTAAGIDAIRQALAATPPAPEGEAEREGKHLRSLVQRWHAGEIVALELAQGVGAVAHRLVDEPPSPAGPQAEGAGGDGS